MQIAEREFSDAAVLAAALWGIERVWIAAEDLSEAWVAAMAAARVRHVVVLSAQLVDGQAERVQKVRKMLTCNAGFSGERERVRI